MNKIIFFILGIFFIINGFQGVIEGTTTGIGNSQVLGNLVSFAKNPIEFTLMVLFNLAVGVFMIKVALSKNNNDK